MKLSQVAVLASVALGGLAVQAGSASALPMIDTGPAAVMHSDQASGIQDVRWHGPYGWHRPWHRGYGWHRPWGWHHPLGWRHGWHHRHWR